MHKDSNPELPPETRHAIRVWARQAALGLVGYGAIIFLSAGTLTWLWGWVLLGVIAAVLLAHLLILVPTDPDLLVERGKGIRDQGVKDWDKWIAVLAAGVCPVSSWVVAGTELRMQQNPPGSLASHLIGLLIHLLGYALFLWAMDSNAFFAEGVRIQTERGHTVAAGGPYRCIRHPGYAGAILAQLATPCLLGSSWAWIPSAASALLYILRTALEDRTLLAELPGYTAYAQQTRCRLLPGIW